MKKGEPPAGGAGDGELKLALVEALGRMGKPVSATELRKALPKPYQRPPKELAQVLAALARARTIFEVGAGKSPRFTHQNPDELVSQAIVTALRGGPLSKPDLTKRVKKAAPGLEKRMAPALADLLARGAVREHPKVGTKLPLRYALDPPDPAPYLDKAVKEVKAVLVALAPNGVTLAAVYAALGRALGIKDPAQAEDGARDDQALVLAAVRELASREPPGTLLSVRAVRALRPLDKARFDRAVLRLSEAGQVVIHHHDFPASLSAQERAELVEDSRGVHYIGIAPRRSA